MNEVSPGPDELLRAAAREGKGRLKVFLGAAPGVGKTYEMLSDGAVRRDAGVDVAIGVVETHGRQETEAKVSGFEIMPRKRIEYEGHLLSEMDIDAILKRRPGLVLVDELAHTNAPGSRHNKRYQDVEELLEAGIDVYSTLNIQHLESLNDLVASFTHVRVRETLPDRVIENAELEIVDIPPDELIERLREGKVYVPEEASRALGHFFSKSNLSALRELALRRAAQAVDAQMLDYVRANALGGNFAVNDRLVVAISEQPGSAELVRAAKRLADALRAPWTAVHIETPRSAGFSEAENGRLAKTMQLATQLGAQIATIPAQNILTGLKQFAADARATQLIVGKSARSRWFEFRHGSIVDRLIRETPGLAVHALPLEATQPPRPSSWQRSGAMPETWIGYYVSLGLGGLVTLIGKVIFEHGNITNIGLLYLVPVMLAATRYGMRTGIVTSLSCSLAYNFFFIPPLHTFTIRDPQNIITVLVLLGVAVVGSRLASQVREQALLAQASAAQNISLAGFARQLTGISAVDELSQLLCREVGQLLECNAVLLMPDHDQLAIRSSAPPGCKLEMLDDAAAKWTFQKNKPAGRGSDTLTASEWLFYPVGSAGKVLAVFGLSRSDARTPIRSDQVPLLLSLLDQAGLALERIALEEEMSSLAQVRERDRLRQALLSSVSHDLRTPLTTILASLKEIRPSSPEQAAQISATCAEAERLHRFVANLLDMVRIEAGSLHQKIEPVDLSEAVASAIHDLGSALQGHRIRIEIPPDLPFVMVDPQLFHHCLINLIENAAKYGSPGMPVTVKVRRDSSGLTLCVDDEGPGIPVGEESRIFETFVRIEGSDRKGGTGLGLAIVKGFAEAMNLEVSASNREVGRGASFMIVFSSGLLKDIPSE